MRKPRRNSAVFQVALAFTIAGIGPLAADSQEPASTRAANSPIKADDLAFFEANVRPLLAEHCTKCHGEQKQEGGLRLDSRGGWQAGGESGSALVPGKPEQSLLIKAVSYQETDLQMPPAGQLATQEVAALKHWIRLGAPDPREAATSAAAKINPDRDAWAEAFKKRLEWWSLQPLARPEPPAVSDRLWASEPVDRFLRAALDRAGLTPAAPAEPEVLLRRLAFVLTGLPPTPSEREHFLAASDPSLAYTQLVDRFLASPHFGERLARHWMDSVRYTDTYGYEWDNPAKGSWEYRDYLIRAFNQDLDFRQFVTEQLAGDLLTEPRINSAQALNESQIGPMFYHLGEHRHGSSLAFNGIHQDMVNNKIDAFSKTFLAISVACARCHDHKLEAVSQRDYYALAAVFMTPRWSSRVVDAPGKNDAAIERLKSLRGEIRREIASAWREAVDPNSGWSIEALKATLDAKDAAGIKVEDVCYPIAQLLLLESNAPKATEPDRAPGAQQQAEPPTAAMDAGKLWADLAKRWQTARNERQLANASFTALTNLENGALPAGWVAEGDGLKHGFVDDGTPLVALTGNEVVSRLLERGIHTGALSSKLPGAVRSPPDETVPGHIVSVRIAGGEFSACLPVPANAFQNEPLTFLDSPEATWRSFVDEKLHNGVQRVVLEFVTSPLNPNFPPRTKYAKGLADTDLGYDKRSWFSITGIVSHEKDGKPQDTLDSFVGLFEANEGTPAGPAVLQSNDEAWQQINAWLHAAVIRWCNDKVQPGDVPILNWLLTKKLLPSGDGENERLAELVAEYRRLEGDISYPRTVNGMDERGLARSGYPLDVRGNVDTPGELISPDFLQMFAGRHDVAKSAGSGRLELARSLIDPEHPLTTRVYVNRVWQWVFGTGLVATPNDFGRLGDKPSNPELLDYLAREFVRENWSTKTLVRRLLLSQAFQQGGSVTPAARQRDPENRLLHHYPTRRLEAEAIRDALLAVSGRLDPTLYGRPIDPARTIPDPMKRLFSGPLDGDGRRSIYLKMSIMDPPKFLTGFNLPDLRLPTGKRDVTNVPSQALIMLNDPLVTSLARHWAKQLVTKSEHAAPADRVRAMFLTAFARRPQPAEIDRWTNALQSFATSAGRPLMEDEDAWTELAHAMFNAQEFIYYR